MKWIKITDKLPKLGMTIDVLRKGFKQYERYTNWKVGKYNDEYRFSN